MKWKAWLKSLAAVAIGGAATGAAHAVGDGQVNVNTAVTAGVGALATVLAYIMQSPLITSAAGTPPAAPVRSGAAEPAPDSSDSQLGR